MSERPRMSRWLSLPLLLLAACPKKPPAELVPPQEPGVGCPEASFVYMATYVQPPEGEKGYTGWVLPLHDVKVASVQGQPSFATIDAAAAGAAGVPVKPSTIWLVPPNAPLCKAIVGNYYAAAIEGTTPNITYGVELEGCDAPKDDATALALLSVAPPSECKVSVPRPVAARVGELDQAGTWKPPTKETAIPDALAALVPTKDCTSPACEKLWSIAAIERDGKPLAYGAAVNWVTHTTGGACPYKTEAWSGFFVAGADGALTKVTDGQEHPLALTHLLTDAQGGAVLVAQGPGEYATYGLATGAPLLGRHLVWLVEEPEAYEAVDHLGPDCSPTGAPAP